MSLKGKNMKKLATAAALLLLLLLTPFFYETCGDEPAVETSFFAKQPEQAVPQSALPGGWLAVHFIYVGQGDAILIQTTDGCTLIDGGPRAYGKNVVHYLNKLGVGRLNLVIATHPHEDHIGGLVEILQVFPVDEIIDSAVPHTSNLYEEYLTLIDEKKIPFTAGRAGMARDLGGGASLQIIHPVSPSVSNLNNASVVVMITFGRVVFLLTGDAEASAERAILGRESNLKSSVLKVGHHGSSTSTTQEFLDAVKPVVAVICHGPNKYGHPHEETLQRLAAAGCSIYGTGVHGSFFILTDGNDFIIYKAPDSFLP